MSMRRRLALTLSALFAVVVVLYAALTWFLAGRNVTGAIDDQLAEQADTAELLIMQERIGRFSEFSARAVDRLGETTFRVQLVEANGRIQGDEELPVDPDVIDDARRGAGDQYTTIELDGRSFRMVTRGVRGDVLQLATDIQSIEDGLRGLRGGLFLAGLIGIGAAGLVGWFVARRFTRPIVDVTRAAEQLAERGELPQPIETDRRDEIGRLAESFNELLSELEMSQRQQERLVADASHELRTPLTSLRVKIDFLRSEPDLPDEQRATIIAGAAVELEALGDLVAELVDLATASSVDEPTEQIDLGEVVEEAARRARLTTHRPITTSTEGAVVLGRPNMIRRAIGNLIGNADKYSPTGEPIEISEFGGGIEVRDHGSGFDEETRRHAFDRFYRAADVQHLAGSGIGLAIVKRAADIHGGEVWIDDAQGGGAVVGFSVGHAGRAGRSPDKGSDKPAHVDS